MTARRNQHSHKLCTCSRHGQGNPGITATRHQPGQSISDIPCLALLARQFVGGTGTSIHTLRPPSSGRLPSGPLLEQLPSSLPPQENTTDHIPPSPRSHVRDAPLTQTSLSSSRPSLELRDETRTLYLKLQGERCSCFGRRGCISSRAGQRLTRECQKWDTLTR